MPPLTMNKTMINYTLKTTLLYGLDFSLILSILNTRFWKLDQFPSVCGQAPTKLGPFERANLTLTSSF